MSESARRAVAREAAVTVATAGETKAEEGPRPAVVPARLASDSSSDDSEDEAGGGEKGAGQQPRRASVRRKWGSTDIRGSALSILNAVAVEGNDSDDEAAAAAAKVRRGVGRACGSVFEAAPVAHCLNWPCRNARRALSSSAKKWPSWMPSRTTKRRRSTPAGPGRTLRSS